MWTPARIGTLAVTALSTLAAPAVVAAQVTVDQQTSNAATNTTEHNFSFTCTAGRPYLVLIAINPHVIAAPIVSVVYDPAGSNVSLTSAGTGAEYPDGAHGSYIYTRSDGAGCNGSSKTMRITYTDEASQSNAVAISFNGAFAVTPFTDYTTQLAATTAISITVPNVAANDYAVSIWSVHNPTTVTAGTQIAQTGSGHMGVSVRRAGNGTMSGTQDFNEP